MNIGIVGAGFMGRMHSSVYRHIDDAKVVGVADVDRSKAEDLAQPHSAQAFTDLDDLLAGVEVDVVDLCLPTYLHCENAVRAARSGKHVLCEKPIATRIEDASRMVRESQEAGVTLMIAHCIRFWPQYRALKGLVDEGAFGPLRRLWLSRLAALPTWSWESWLMDPKRSGGAALDLHIHDTDYVLYLLGRPESVRSRGIKTERGWDHIITDYDYDGPGKLVVTAESGWGHPQCYPFSMAFRALFEKGVAEFNSKHGGDLIVYPEGDGPRVLEVEELNLGSGNGGGNISDLGGYYAEIRYFIDCLKSGKQPEVVAATDATDSLAVVLAEMESLETAGSVPVGAWYRQELEE